MGKYCFCNQNMAKIFFLLTYVLISQIHTSICCAEILPSQYVTQETNITITFSLSPPTDGTVPYLVQFDSVSLVSITYIDGNVTVDDSHPNIAFTGDGALGNMSFLVTNFGRVSAGIYSLQIVGLDPLQCITVYVLGKPVVLLNISAEEVDVGRSILFTCSSTSTTVPNDHHLGFSYNWTVFETFNTTIPRFIYTNNTLEISNVLRTDHNKTVNCRATENVAGGLTSDKSGQVLINVLYGPENIRHGPSQASYIIQLGETIADIKCEADCNPQCSYIWTKEERTVGEQTLSLGTLNKSDAGIYTCRAVRGSFTLTKNLTLDIIYGPTNISLSPSNSSYRQDEFNVIENITCDADCWQCEYLWTGPHALPSGPSLLFDTLERDKAGIYTCTARNTRSLNTSTAIVIVEIRYGPDSIQLVPNQSTHAIDEGGQLGILCTADCFPNCTYVWSKLGENSSVSTDQHLSLETNITRSDAGNYTCNARNPETKQTSSVIVTVHVRFGPDAVVLMPSSETYTENEGSVIGDISCFAECYPSCSYEWTKSGQIVSSLGVLSLGTLLKEKNGTYWCRVSNPETKSSVTSNITVNVRYGPDSIQLVPNQSAHVIDEDSDLDITCIADCFPICTYVWTKQEQNTSVSTDQDLSFKTNVTRSTAGNYTCTARNPETTKNTSVDIMVHIRYGPDDALLTPSADTYTENEGSVIDAITCSADCYPNCTYAWTKQEQTVSNSGVLSLGTLSKEKSGTYMCTAFLPKSSSSARSNISVNVRYGPHVIDLVPRDQHHTVIEGDTMQPISCSSDCYPVCTQTWTNDTSKEQLGSEGTLSLEIISRYFTGEYGCTTSNQATEYNKSLAISVQVTVQYFPDVSVIQENGNDTSESDAIVPLLCSAQGEPDTYRFARWVHTAPDHQTEIQEYPGITTGGQNRLLLQMVSYMDSGMYTCSVTNTIKDYRTGKLFATKTLNLTVKGKPVLMSIEPRKAADVLDNVIVNVTFYSNDGTEPLVVWWRNDKDSKVQLKSGNDKYKIQTKNTSVYIQFYSKTIQQPGYLTELMIINVTEADFAAYQIEVINSVGFVTSQVTLSPKGPPEVSVMFSALTDISTATSITLTWHPGFHSGADQTFHIEYRVNGTLEWQKALSIFGGKQTELQLNATVSDLSADTLYQFMLYAENQYGKSDAYVIVAKTPNTKEDLSEQTKGNSLVLTAGIVGGAIVVAGFVAVLVSILVCRYRRHQHLENPHLNRQHIDNHHLDQLASGENSYCLQPVNKLPKVQHLIQQHIDNQHIDDQHLAQSASGENCSTLELA